MVRDDGQRPGDLADNTARNQVGPLNQFKAELNALYAALLSPPYRDLETQADLAGIRLSRSTIGDLLTRDVRPTWRTVDKFVRACRLYYEAPDNSRTAIEQDAFDLIRWKNRHRQLVAELSHAEVADDGARSEPKRPQLIGVLPQRARFRERTDIPLPGLLSADGPDCSVLRGLAGNGKTLLAAALARQQRDAGDIDLLVWVDASSRGKIVAKYALAGREAASIEESADEIAAERFLSWLATTERRWLIVLDDLTAVGDLQGLWPPPAFGRGQTVVTTQLRDAALRGDRWQFIEVDAFKPADARDFLLAQLADQPELARGAEELAAALDYLPLALAQATDYMLNRGLNCAQYLGRLADQHLPQLLPEKKNLPDDQQATVTAVWKLSVERANALQPEGLAHPVLELASVLNPNGIPVGVFTTPAARDYLAATRDSAALVSIDDARDAVYCLHRLSLLSLEQDMAVVHGLVQRATRDDIDARADGQLEAVIGTAADALLSAWPSAENNAEQALLFRINTAAVDSLYPGLLRRNGIHPLLLRAGRSLAESGDLTAAAEYFQRLRDSANPPLDASHPDRLRIEHHLAYCMGQRGGADNAREAAVMAAAATAGLARVLGPDHPDTLEAQVYLARWYGLSGEYDRAYRELSDLIPRLTRVAGREDSGTLTARNDAALFCGKAGHKEKAAQFFTELLADRRRALGADHPHTLTTRNDLAVAKGESGRPVDAVADFLGMVDDFTRVLGPDHLRTLAVRGNAAYWRAEAGDPALAIRELKSVLADFERIHGPQHRFTQATRDRLEAVQHLANG